MGPNTLLPDGTTAPSVRPITTYGSYFPALREIPNQAGRCSATRRRLAATLGSSRTSRPTSHHARAPCPPRRTHQRAQIQSQPSIKKGSSGR